MNATKRPDFERGWVGVGRNYFHNLGSEPWRSPSVLEGGDLYTWGLEEEDNSCKENGPGVYQYCEEVPLKPKTQKSLKDGQIAPAACSSAATFFLSGSRHNRITTLGTVHGHVMNPGLEEIQGATNHSSFSAFDNVSPSVLTIPLPLSCVELAAGRHFCLARLEGGLAVCSWGAGHFGQLGHGTTSFAVSSSNDDAANPTSTSTYQATAKVIERLLPRMIGSPIVQIAAGDWHGMALSQEGTVYAWGCNRNMQCGRKSTRSNSGGANSGPLQMVPLPITILSEDPDKLDEPAISIAKIAAGKAHSVAISKTTHHVYCWGASHYGQCASNTGNSTRSSKYTRNTMALPRMVQSLQDVHVVDVAAGDRHTLALTQGGRVFSWGAGGEGQLGIFPPLVCTPKPRLILDLDFVAIAAGELQTSSFTNVNAIDLASVPTITSLHAAGCSSFALSSNGHVYAWGSNDAGTLGLPTPSPDRLPYWEVGMTRLPPDGERLLQVRTFDSEHNVLLPRRIDSLVSVQVEQIITGPNHAWFLGENRASQGIETNVVGECVLVGRTLYEVQQMRKQQGGPSGGGNDSTNKLSQAASFNATSSSWARSTSAGNTSSVGEDSLYNSMDGTSRSMMSPTSTMPTDEEDDFTATDLMSASMSAFEVSLDRRELAPASTLNVSGHSLDSRLRHGRRYSDPEVNPQRPRQFSLSNLMRRLSGKRRGNNAAIPSGQSSEEQSGQDKKNIESNGEGGGRGRFRLRSGIK